MSLKTFFTNIFHHIRNTFEGLLPDLKGAVHVGVAVAEAIKQFDTSMPIAADIITSLIPGGLDDLVKERIRQALPDILIQLRLVDATLGLPPERMLEEAMRVIKESTGDQCSEIMHSLSIMITRVAADGRIDWRDAVYLVEWYYDERVKKNTGLLNGDPEPSWLSSLH